MVRSNTGELSEWDDPRLGVGLCGRSGEPLDADLSNYLLCRSLIMIVHSLSQTLSSRTFGSIAASNNVGTSRLSNLLLVKFLERLSYRWVRLETTLEHHGVTALPLFVHGY